MLNTPEKDIQPGAGPTFWNQIKKKKGDIKIAYFGWTSVADALTTLAFNGDIEDHAKENSLEIENREIQLTEQGLVSYNKKTYLTNAVNENLAFQIGQSTLNTNWWIKIIGIFTVIFTAIIAGTSIMQCNKDSHPHRHSYSSPAIMTDTLKKLK